MTIPRFSYRDADTLPGVRLRIVGADRRGIPAEQVGLFLFDFSVAFELFRRVAERGDRDRLTMWDLYRGHKRVQPIERLAVERLRMESPIEVIATSIAITTAGIGGIWAAVQALERIYMLPLNRQKAELEVRKLELEVDRLELAEPTATRQRILPRAEVERSARHRPDDDQDARPSRSVLRRSSVLERLMPGGENERSSTRYPYDDNRRVVETVRRRLLRNPIKVEQLELEFDPALPPPAA
jgi:hypothetical protein